MKNAPSAYAIGRAMAEALQLRASLIGPDSGIADADDAALINTIDGETDVFDLLDRLAEHAIADEALVELARERASRIEQRANRNRELMKRMIEALSLSKIERPLYTASIALGPAKVNISDASELPPELTTVSPNKAAIKKILDAGTAVSGASLSNRESVLRILTR